MTADPAARRRELVERFTAGTLERLDAMRRVLDVVSRGRATPQDVRALLREMHTLKGEARMMGFTALGEAGHHGERLLRADPGTAPSTATCNALARLIDAAIATLREPSEAAEAALQAACSALPVSWPGGGPAGDIPFDAPSELPAPAQVPTKMRGRTARILLVDDSTVIRELVGDILKRHGFDVHQAPDGEAALTELAEWRPDLMLLDVDMPRMNGFQLLHRIAKVEHRCPVVMLSSHASEQDREQARSLGAADYVVKSRFKDDALVELVRRHLLPG